MIQYDLSEHKKQLKRKCSSLIQNTNKNYISATEYKNQLFDLLLQDFKNLTNLLYENTFLNKDCNNVFLNWDLLVKELSGKLNEILPFYLDRLNDGRIGNIIPYYELSENDINILGNLLKNQSENEIKKINIKYNEYHQKIKDSKNSKHNKRWACASVILPIIIFVLSPAYNKLIESTHYFQQRQENNKLVIVTISKELINNKIQ